MNAHSSLTSEARMVWLQRQNYSYYNYYYVD
jgi:hypothetical protein